MRLLFEDAAHNDSQTDRIEVLEVCYASDSTVRRDYWFEFKRNVSVVNLYVYKTRAAAQGGAEADRIGELEGITLNLTTIQTLTITAIEGATPSVTGLSLRAYVKSTPIGGTVVWGYTCTPDLVTAENIQEILLGYVASGKPLQDFTTTADPDGDGHILVGDPFDRVQSWPTMAIIPQGMEMVEADGSHFFTILYPIQITIAVHRTEQQDAWTMCRRYIGAVESILLDENRTAMGECTNLEWASSESPTPAQNNDHLLVGSITLKAEYHLMWRDKEYPR